jgi:hypothetical protein
MAAMLTALLLGAGVVPSVPTLAQSSAAAIAHRLGGLRVVAARRVTVEGKGGIEVDFDTRSAEQLVHFTAGAVGQRVTVMVQGRKLATLRLLDPLKDGRILLTGDLDQEAVERLAPKAAVDLVLVAE